jgi:transcriptional regulator with GAF, ATPase, and Fis domain
VQPVVQEFEPLVQPGAYDTRPMPPGFAALLGESPALVGLRHDLEQLVRRYASARRLPPVLLLGETGTGKSLIARVLHEAGPRTGRPFVDVACPAIPETLMESQMFGFERGAFTDARESKAGLFAAADRGTIFLDEIGLLPDSLQVKLLKVVEEQQIRPLGATASKPIDVWVIAATSEDLEAAVRKRRFREDLYYRLAVVTLHVPPLRERGEDVVLLARHLLARACADYELAPRTFPPRRSRGYGLIAGPAISASSATSSNASRCVPRERPSRPTLSVCLCPTGRKSSLLRPTTRR